MNLAEQAKQYATALLNGELKKATEVKTPTHASAHTRQATQFSQTFAIKLAVMSFTAVLTNAKAPTAENIHAEIDHLINLITTGWEKRGRTHVKKFSSPQELHTMLTTMNELGLVVSSRSTDDELNPKSTALALSQHDHMTIMLLAQGRPSEMNVIP